MYGHNFADYRPRGNSRRRNSNTRTWRYGAFLLRGKVHRSRKDEGNNERNDPWSAHTATSFRSRSPTTCCGCRQAAVKWPVREARPIALELTRVRQQAAPLLFVAGGQRKLHIGCCWEVAEAVVSSATSAAGDSAVPKQSSPSGFSSQIHLDTRRVIPRTISSIILRSTRLQGGARR